MVQFCREVLPARFAQGRADRQAWWPESIVANIRAALPEFDFSNIEGSVRDQRAQPSQSELALLGRARSILEDAIDTALTGNHTSEERWAAVQRISRRSGFMDIFGHCHADPETVRSQSKFPVSSVIFGCGVRRRAVATRQRGCAGSRCDSRLAQTWRHARRGASGRGKIRRNRRLERFCLRLPQSPDIETDGAQRPPADTNSEPLQDGEVVLLTCSAPSARGTVALGDMFLVGEAGARIVPASAGAGNERPSSSEGGHAS